MVDIKLFNSLTRKKEKFVPIKKGEVKMYTCGPTVYNYAHIGNFRTFILYDIIKRVFLFNQFKVNHVMNITDIDDKTIKGSRKEGLSLKEFTLKYEKIFVDDLKSLNVIMPNEMPRATEYIDQMVGIIKVLMKKGYAYKANDGIYFSIDKFKQYGKLAQLEKSKDKKERVKSDEYDKENAQDFALWKFYVDDDGKNFWETEIGKGRPGWHIECSAMSNKLLGETIDIHSGAIDLLFPHHTNEIAQSEAANGKKFVNYWVHGAFLNMKEKMSKSLGNVITMKEILNLEYKPLHYRYLTLLTHYRKPLNFSMENLNSAKKAYENLKNGVIKLRKNANSKEFAEDYDNLFLKSINDDLNMPSAIAIIWKLLSDNKISDSKKYNSIIKYDEVLGLGLRDAKEEKISIPKELKELADKREDARKNKNWKLSDQIRDEISKLGYLIEDSSGGYKLSKKN